MTRAFPNWDQRAFPIPEQTTRFPNGGNGYVNPAGDPIWDQVQCLFGFDGANDSTVGDESDVSPALSNVLYFGQARVHTGEHQFGGSALQTDGSGDYVEFDDHPGFSFGSSDFTIEMWVNRDDNSDGMFMAKYDNTAATAEWFFNITHPNVQFLFFYGTGASSWEIMAQSWEITTGAWNHISTNRVGNDLFMHVNGIMMSSLDITGRVLKDAGEKIRISARNHTSPQYFKGWTDEVRVTKGTGRYGGADFTPPGRFPRF